MKLIPPTAIFTPMALAFALLIVVNSAQAARDAVEVQLQRLAEQMSASLPSGNAQSMVISVQAGPGRRFTYNSVQAIPTNEWTGEMKAHSARIARNDYCTNPNLQDFRRAGVTVVWNAADMQGRYVYGNTVSPADCR